MVLALVLVSMSIYIRFLVYITVFAGRTSIGLNTRFRTSRCGGYFTFVFVPCVFNCCAVLVTAVYAQERVSCILAVAVALDRAGVGVIKLIDNERRIGILTFCRKDVKITFLHKVKDGSVDKSYGINVARQVAPSYSTMSLKA